MIELGKDAIGDIEGSFGREWIETNGIGGYASSTVSGANSRRYHGLLVAATKPPLGRVVTLSKFEETVIIDGERFELSTNQYPETIHPNGFRYLKAFSLDPFPIWTFDLDGIEIKRSLFMVYGENTTVVRWSLGSVANEPDVVLEVRPLMAFRDHHHLNRERSEFNTDYSIDNGVAVMRPLADLPSLGLSHNARTVDHEGHWYRDFQLAIEKERGFDFAEDLFQSFCLTFDLRNEACVIASTGEIGTTDTSALEKAELRRRARLIAKSGAKDNISRQLVLAADQFIVSRGKGKTVIAGYHWFSDWGRDTMIALPGLTLSTGRPDVAKSILTEFSKHISEGMLPNRFPDAGEEPEYNTVDATLWFFEAIRAYVQATGDHSFVRRSLYAKLADIIEWHIRGTRYEIKVDDDGLLHAGEPGVQLTWMDAKIGDWVVTPRTGKAVEIQALWYNALCIMRGFADEFGDTEGRKKYKDLAACTKTNFRDQFWNDDAECLFDVIDGQQKDASIRPNQIFAVSLQHTMLDQERARKVVKKVEAELLTPMGLRSLTPNDPRYKPVYIGSPFDRDASYHQGTVWSWLIGPFVDAYRRTHPNNAKTRRRIEEVTAGLRAHLTDAMVGQISEIFDADPPHHPRGCAAQAWSVAELCRVIVDDRS
ncbi:MAG: amylo-alpha-1,6-glucosidase [Pyrinomonadaceae bacterium]